MRDRQRGITAIGFLALAVLVVLVGFAGLQLTPIYLEHTKIMSVLQDVQNEMEGTNPSIQEIRASIGRRLNIEMVRIVKRDDFKIKKSEAGYDVRIQYENEAPYFYNIYLLVRFNDAVEIQR
jgi:hypothetical protein